MVQGRPDDFCEMQTKARPKPPYLNHQKVLPWQSHPGVPKAVQDMKELLTLLLPEHPVSTIEALNTFLLAIADSKERYEDLRTLRERVERYNCTRPDSLRLVLTLTPGMFCGTVLNLDEPHHINYSFIEDALLQNYDQTFGYQRRLRRPSITPQEQLLETDFSEGVQTQLKKQKPMGFMQRLIRERAKSSSRC